LLDGQKAKLKVKEENAIDTSKKASKKRSINETTEEKKSPNSAIRYRVFPSDEQHELLQYWLKVTRFTYNELARHIRQETTFFKHEKELTPEEYEAEKARCNENRKKVLNIKYLRTTFITGINTAKDVTSIHPRFRWLRDEENVNKYGLVPYDIIANAAITLLKNYASNFAKQSNLRKRGQPTSAFCIRLKRWNHPTSMVVPNGKWKPTIHDKAKVKGIFDKAYNDFRFEGGKPRLDVLKYDSTLVYEPLTKQYHLCVPRHIEKRASLSNDELKVISIDPGVRTFLTAYDTSGKVFEFGKDANKRLTAIFEKRCLIQSKLDLLKKQNATGRKRKKKKRREAFYMKVMEKFNRKINNLTTDFHRKVAKFLCSNYNVIIIPKLNHHGFKKSGFGKRRRAHQSLFQHCKFVDRLSSYARYYTRCVVKVVDEMFTSKTCSDCGKIYNIGKDETFFCKGEDPECRVKNNLQGIGRDVNAAKNILLRYVSSL